MRRVTVDLQGSLQDARTVIDAGQIHLAWMWLDRNRERLDSNPEYWETLALLYRKAGQPSTADSCQSLADMMRKLGQEVILKAKFPVLN